MAQKYRITQTFRDDTAGDKWYVQGDTAEFPIDVAKDLISARVICPILEPPTPPKVETADKSLGNENATKPNGKAK